MFYEFRIAITAFLLVDKFCLSSTSGGEVNYKKAEGTNDVDTLFIQTVTMKKNLARNKPTIF